MTAARCRICRTLLIHSFADLGMSPLSNSYLKPEDLHRMEPFYPLHARVCESCYLVQLEPFRSPEEMFSDYAYFSSYSESWLKHARAYVEYMRERFGFDGTCRVVEIGSNDGYLLQYFKGKGIAVLGIEPAENVARVAQTAGIPTVVKFFGVKTAKGLVDEGKEADLLLGNNVLAHVHDLHDFVDGLKILLKPNGVITMEFPHLLRLIEQNQFDTIYHEHLSYFLFITVEKLFAGHGLTLFDVQELPTHGGSLRIFAHHAGEDGIPVTGAVEALRRRERDAGLEDIRTYEAFVEKLREAKRNILDFLIQAKRAGKTIVSYGAPAKGNTLLNYCGIRTDMIDYTVDRNPHKQGHFLPGSHIPVYPPEKIRETKPDYVFILPWNIRDEIMEQMAGIRAWGGRFVVPIPRVEVLS